RRRAGSRSIQRAGSREPSDSDGSAAASRQGTPPGACRSRTWAMRIRASSDGPRRPVDPGPSDQVAAAPGLATISVAPLIARLPPEPMDQLVAPVRAAVTAASWVLTAGSAQAFLV